MWSMADMCGLILITVAAAAASVQHSLSIIRHFILC